MGEIFHIVVSGRVQGVGFRFHAEAAAHRLGITGWVRNLPTGEVEVLARIPAGRKSQFLEALRRGPPLASVRELQVRLARDLVDDCPEGTFSVRH